jgi:hypothetical protein
MSNEDSAVYLVQHMVGDREETCKTVGIYTSKEAARLAVRRLRRKPGFCDHPKGFYIDKYLIDKDHWSDGFGNAWRIR